MARTWTGWRERGSRADYEWRARGGLWQEPRSERGVVGIEAVLELTVSSEQTVSLCATAG